MAKTEPDWTAIEVPYRAGIISVRQIAKSFGAEVTGVDSTSKLDLMRSVGADHVIDYMQEDFTHNG